MKVGFIIKNRKINNKQLILKQTRNQGKKLNDGKI